jgi:hypothetical protein
LAIGLDCPARGLLSKPVGWSLLPWESHQPRNKGLHLIGQSRYPNNSQGITEQAFEEFSAKKRKDVFSAA